MYHRNRRGFSLVEILVSLGVLGVLMVPFLDMTRPAAMEITTEASMAENLIHNVTVALNGMDSGALKDLVEKGPSAGTGYHEVALAGIPGVASVADSGAGARRVDDLKPRLFLRINRHVNGQFGLDRFDVRLSWQQKQGREIKERWVARTLVRRNHPHLVALSSVRMHSGDLRAIPEAQFKETMFAAAVIHSIDERRGIKDGSPFPIPQFPSILCQFEPPVEDQKELEERKVRLEAFGENYLYPATFFTDVGQAPRPDFGGSSSVCN